ncbi:uncharacterized protein LOC136063523 [Quercus suber]|uniref:uncharacterized protein LOC136063523 n=1 Tax=Quercus suber TaxID=58331 RepID=UPI0032DFD191
MSGDSLRRNQSFHCQYHQEQGHTTEDCWTLWSHLEQLVKEGKLQHLMCHPNGKGTINVIFAALGRTRSQPSRVMYVARFPAKDTSFGLKRPRIEIQLALSFSDEDEAGTIQPHDDALVVTLRIGGYDVKRVMVDHGNCSGIMYPNLYKGLHLKPEDLTAYDFLLVSFDEKVVNLKGQIRLPVQVDSEVVEVDFIVVDAYSPYMAIVARL